MDLIIFAFLGKLTQNLPNSVFPRVVVLSFYVNLTGKIDVKTREFQIVNRKS